MEDILQILIQLLRKASYSGIVLALSCEIIPSEFVLPLAGFLVSEGQMAFWPVVFAGVIGGTLGSFLPQ